MNKMRCVVLEHCRYYNLKQEIELTVKILPNYTMVEVQTLTRLDLATICFPLQSAGVLQDNNGDRYVPATDLCDGTAGVYVSAGEMTFASVWSNPKDSMTKLREQQKPGLGTQLFVRHCYDPV